MKRSVPWIGGKSIRSWILLVFFIVFAISLALVSLMGLRRARADAKRRGEEIARSCGEVISFFLRRWEFGNTGVSSEARQVEDTRAIARNLCECFDLDYLYVYSIDSEKRTRRYHLCASSDPVKDEKAQELLIEGASTSPLMPAELSIIEGDFGIHHLRMSNRYGDEGTWLIPFVGADGSLRALIGVEFSMGETRQAVRRNFVAGALVFWILVTSGYFVLSFLMDRRISRPMNELSERMMRFAHEDRRRPEVFKTDRKDEIGRIALSFKTMTEEISAYENDLEVLTREKAESEAQMDTARRIQSGMVPQSVSFVSEGCALSALTRPARRVGGDFYDCFRRGDGKVCVLIGDVSGKGITAAIFMSMTRTMIREKLRAGLDPVRALLQTNAGLMEQNPEGMFATAFAAVFDPISGELEYSNAGHTRPILLMESASYLHMESGTALGLFEDAELKEESLRLLPGQGLVLYTDGVTDARGRSGELFGSERLLNAVESSLREGWQADGMLRAICDAADAFSIGLEPFDDMAVLVLMRQTATEQVAAVQFGSWHRLPVSSRSFEDIKRIVFGAAGDSSAVRRALLACDEALANIVRYSGASSLTFRCEASGGMLDVEFVDDGADFDPASYVCREKDFEDLDSGGMGIRIMREAAAEMRHSRENGRNSLLMRFALGGSG